MKTAKLLMAGALAISAANLADAQTVIRLTGSTAFRAATHAAITNSLQPGYTFAYSGSSIGSASQAIFTGVAKTNGASVIIKTSWSGSVGGIQTVANQLNISTWLTNTTPQSAWPGAGSAPAVYDPPTPPNVAMSDSFQGSTPFTSPTLKQTIVGVVPFKWVASKDCPVANLNVTPKSAQNLFRTGKTPLAVFTGNPADETTIVYAIGRDPDSGTRLTALAETGIGVLTTIQQYQPTVSGSTVTGQALWPTNTVNGIFVGRGNGGYSSGGTLAGVMTNTTAAIGGFYLTYLGLSDAGAALPNGAKEATFNGVYYGTNAVQEGQYTFWGYEHLMYRTDYTGVGQVVADSVAAQLKNQDAAVSGILSSAMSVSRSSDGGLISTLY
jgi:hypothetical protein